MKRTNLLFALICTVAGTALLQACASFPQQKEMHAMARVFDLPYDKVWQSVEDLLHRDLKCIFKKEDKKDGVLETEWVHRMDTEGKKRWMIGRFRGTFRIPSAGASPIGVPARNCYYR